MPLRILKHLVWHDNMKTADLLKYKFTPSDFCKPDKVKWGENKNKASLNPLLYNSEHSDSKTCESRTSFQDP